MSPQLLDLGKHLRSSDGKLFGAVDGVVLDPVTNEITYLVLDRGFIPGKKLVDIGFVVETDGHGTVLSIPADQVEHLPNFVRERYVQAHPTTTMAGPEDQLSTLGAIGTVWLPAGVHAGDIHMIGDDGRYAVPSASGVVIQDVSSVPESSVTITEGTAVVGSDGHKIGHVDELLLDGDRIIGFVVKTGVAFPHDVRVPMEWVAGIAHDHIRLNLVGAAAAARGRVLDEEPD
jgi:sporulation protein YlmC with PRC-barrel domain